MLPPGLNSVDEVLQHYDRVYFDLINSGRAQPFLYPWGSLGALLILLYLFIDHRRSRLLERLRFVIFALVLAFEAWCLTNRARNPAVGFGVGLVSAFGTLWVLALAIANDCQSDFRRIDRRSEHHVLGPGPSGDAKATGFQSSSNGNLSQRDVRAMSSPSTPPRESIIYWQSYPTDSFLRRLDWIIDMFTSFRGVGWSWQTAGIPPPPKWVEAQLKNGNDAVDDDDIVRISRTGIRRFGDRSELLRVCCARLVIGYIALDALKTIVVNDQYFWGYTSAPAPDFYPELIRSSHIITVSIRLLISLSAIYCALWFIFGLGPLFFCGILGPRWIGIRGEPWMNPADMFGSFSSVLDKGLAGWWGGWWHQTFRFAFEAPAVRLLKVLGVDKRSKLGKMISLFTAFFLSGVLHGCGSYTQLGDTSPLNGPMRFFMLQAVGITMQTWLAEGLSAAGVVQHVPKRIRQLTNFLFVHIWLYHTAPLLVDDFAQGGVWLFEPVPISIFRGVGLGPKGTGWWCGWEKTARWRSGRTWLDTGIEL